MATFAAMIQSYDVIVVGGGICGLSTALFLGKQSLKVVVLEAETIGAFTQASSVNSGIVETFENTDTTSFASPDLLLAHALRE